METELKFLVKDVTLTEDIFTGEYLRPFKDLDSEEKIEMRATYFDTPDRTLFREGIAFRIRREDEKNIATLKWNGSSEEGMHKREEINIPVNDEKYLNNPDIHIFDQSEMAEILENAVGQKTLEAIMNVNFQRRQMRIDTGKSICELSVDVGEICCGGRSEPISELEIELYSGDENDMKRLGAKIAEKYNLVPENESKYKRGLNLLK